MGAASGSRALQLEVAALLEVLTSLSSAVIWVPGQQPSQVGSREPCGHPASRCPFLLLLLGSGKRSSKEEMPC